MQLLRMLGGLVFVPVVALSVSAQPTIAIVKQPKAEVRSGPSEAAEYYPTNLLLQGDRVEIVRQEENGWLAIKPPAGSVSWVNKRFVRQFSKNTWTGESEAEVDVLYGSALYKEKPNVISARLQRGTQVQSVGEAYVPPDGGVWLPIKPPPTEARYIRATAVTLETVTVQNPSIPADGQAAGGGTQRWNNPAVPLVPTPSATPPAPIHPRWAEAERAQREGRIKEAIDLYDQLGREVANSDHQLAMRCYNQAAALRRGNSYALDTRLRPTATGSTPPSVTNYAPQSCCTPCGQNDYVFRGVLREAYQSLDHKPTFVLVNNQGQIVAYATSAGAELEKQLNRVVEVSGPACYSGYVRSNYVRATRVAPLQGW